VSVMQFNSREIRCRNYTDRTIPIQIRKPAQSQIQALFAEPVHREIQPVKVVDGTIMHYNLCPGDYSIELTPYRANSSGTL
ncbi:MAG: hypothetical protein JW795_01585, partial [Chitinivibrionales bacterium]|nr:hypothetical protein [Chitinivibrionales bacterium]